MHTYLMIFTVNGVRTEQKVSAYSSSEARKLIESQYLGNKIRFITVKQL